MVRCGSKKGTRAPCVSKGLDYVLKYYFLLWRQLSIQFFNTHLNYDNLNLMKESPIFIMVCLDNFIRDLLMQHEMHKLG